MPSKVLNNKSPYEVLFNHPPYDHLKTFASLCLIFTLSHNKNKFSPRAIKCVFLDYPSGVKGYQVLYLDLTLFLFQKTIFYETIFPFASIHSPSSPSNPTSLGINTFDFPLCILVRDKIVGVIRTFYCHKQSSSGWYFYYSLGSTSLF